MRFPPQTTSLQNIPQSMVMSPVCHILSDLHILSLICLMFIICHEKGLNLLYQYNDGPSVFSFLCVLFLCLARPRDHHPRASMKGNRFVDVQACMYTKIATFGIYCMDAFANAQQFRCEHLAPRTRTNVAEVSYICGPGRTRFEPHVLSCCNRLVEQNDKNDKRV